MAQRGLAFEPARAHTFAQPHSYRLHALFSVDKASCLRNRGFSH